MWQRPSRWAKTGHASLALHAGHQAFAATRHDDVDCAVQAAQHRADGGAVGDRNKLDSMLWKSGGLQALDEAGMDSLR